MSIPRRPSQNYLDSAEQQMGGSPLTGRPPFAGTSAPRAGSSGARQANAYGAAPGRTASGGGQPSDPGSGSALSRLSVSPQLPFAFTPQPLSASSSLASGLHPLAQMVSPPASCGSADVQSRFALALRRSSWSPASSLAQSSSLSLVGLSAASPVFDCAIAHSPPLAGCGALLQRLTHHSSYGGACSPESSEAELEPLPFALEDVFGDAPEDEVSTTSRTSPRMSARYHNASRFRSRCFCTL